MCGIAGFVDFSGHPKDFARARLARMTRTLVHRGPDDEGYYVDEHIALGHRRLSVIDVVGGHQPMSAAEGAVRIVFNGEIYNYQALREQLASAGHRFGSQSDTEVLLHAYLEWGSDFLERLNGMFAFALWDARHRHLILARDRVGKKPLYYLRCRNGIAFASELKALRAGEFCEDAIDPQALDCYFTLGYVPAPRTIHRGVRKLRAAHSLVVSDAGERETRYWDLRFDETRSIQLDEAVEELDALLDDAVRCRLVGDVPLGAFLSGGIDSSLVVSSMARSLSRPVVTNSIGFDETGFDELEVARATASALATDHREQVVRPDAVSVLPRIAWHFDEPLADPGAIPTWYACAMARGAVTVALSGDGGDEAFAGYTFRYLPHVAEARVRGVVPVALRTMLFGLAGGFWPRSPRLPRPLRLQTIFENLAESDGEAFYRDLAWLREDSRESVYSADFVKTLKGFTPRETILPLYVGNDARDALGRAQYADIHSFMTDDVLVKVDRMSMAHSLEVRSPLLDFRILEFAARLPSGLKMGTRRGKLPLRALARRRLPGNLHGLSKRGFSMPVSDWLRGALRSMAEDLLFSKRHPVLDALNGVQLRALWFEHLAGRRDHGMFIWTAMMLVLWAESIRASPVSQGSAHT